MTPVGVLIICMFGVMSHSLVKASDKGKTPTIDEFGKANSKYCVFPFTYKGKTYHHCTTDHSIHTNFPWCATDKDFNERSNHSRWGFCKDSNNGPNPRDIATCSLNGEGKITTVTFDDANIEFERAADKCSILLSEAPYNKTKKEFAFKIFAFTKAEKKKSAIYRVDARIFNKETNAYTDISVRRHEKGENKGTVMVNGKVLTKTVLESGVHMYGKSIRFGIREKTAIVDAANTFRLMYRYYGGREDSHVNVLLFKDNLGLKGLCGNNDGSPRNDYVPKDGAAFDPDKQEIDNSWTIGSCIDDI